MLAILSDLHLCDGSASGRNVDPKAFDLAIGELYDQAAAIADKASGRTASLDLVFLGDVFDLLRTERWFDLEAGERPWGKDARSPSVMQKAEQILDGIIQQNRAVLATLAGRNPRLAQPAGVVVRRFYLPGNHDRMCFLGGGLQEKCMQALDASPSVPEEGFHLRKIQSQEYGVLARHGHEWDEWNFELYSGKVPDSYQEVDYAAMPIGDPITTELLVGLPFLLQQNLQGSNLTDQEREHVFRRMQHIEDVRPLMAAFCWVYYEAGRVHAALPDSKKADLARALDRTVNTLADQFLGLTFFQEWARRHHRLFHFDCADQLKTLLKALRVAKCTAIGDFAAVFERVMALIEVRDTCRLGAAREDLGAAGGKGMRFVVYGHTHTPLQVALRADVSRDLYLNSGTFRQAIFRTDDRKGFIGWDRMTYLSFFSQDELGSLGVVADGPGFDSWTGNRGK